MVPDWSQFDPLLQEALSEDAVLQDITTHALIPADWQAKSVIMAKQDGVVCGLPLTARLCSVFFPSLAHEAVVEDGSEVAPGSEIAYIAGPAGILLGIERVMLNFLQKLSGIATLTRQYVNAVSGTGVAILDTRKTTPGWRVLEKYAVNCGGGVNHRMDLGAGALIKENHLRLVAAGAGVEGPEAVAGAIQAVKKASAGLPLAVEVENLPQLQAALENEPDIVLLDNMVPAGIRRSIECIERVCASGVHRPQIEVSGGITLANVRSYALPGVDRISIGTLTHSAPALDLALDVV